MAGANELIAIELQLKGYEGVMADFRALDQMLNGFRGRKNKITIQSDLAKTKKEIIALQGELNKLKQLQYDLGNKGIKSEGLDNKIKETTQRLREAQQAVREFQYALRNLSSQSFKQTFNKISSAVAHIGSAMQSAGNALTRLTSPFANFTKGIVMGAGYTALNKFTQGLENGFTRYDTMKKYPKIMAAFGYSNEEAQKSIDALDKSVRGLPTGLDEMVDLAQRFTATTGDIEKGTKLAIAANNAFLASMSTDTQKYQGMMQLQDVLGGKDMNAREWNSLVSSMTPAIVKMGESLGYTSKNMNEWIQQVRDGKVDNQKFVDTLIEIGNEGGVLQAMANESKDTWQAFFANVGNAASRMTAGLITSMDEVVKALNLKDKDGLAITSVNRLLSDRMIPAIDNMTASLKAWIQAHPEEITDFFESLAKINWQSLLKGVGEGILAVADLVKRFADAFGGRDLSRIGRWMIKGNILGNGLTILGGLLKGTRHIIGGFGATLFHGGRALYNIRKYGLMGYLGKVLTVGDAGEEAMETATKTVPKMGRFATGLSKVFKGWAEIATMVGGTAFVAWGSMKMFKGAIKDFGEIVELVKGIDWKTGSTVFLAMADAVVAFIGFGSKLGTALGKDGLIGGAVISGLTLMFSGTFWADMAMIKRGFKAIADATDYINITIDNLSKVKDVDGGVKNKVSNAIDVFNDIIKTLNPDTMSKASDAEGNAGKGLKHLGGDVRRSIKNIADTIGFMRDAIEALNELNGMKVEKTNLEGLVSDMSDALTSLQDVIITMPSIFKDGSTVESTSNLSSSLANLKTSFNHIIGKGGILERIPQMLSTINSLMRSASFDTLPSKMQVLGDALKGAYDALNSGIGNGAYMATNLDNFRQALKSAKFAIKHLQELGGMSVSDGVVDNIKDIFDKIKQAFSIDAVNSIKQPIDDFVTAIKDALQTIKDLNEEIEVDITFKLSQGFYDSKKKVINEIKKAKKEIRGQNSPISFSIGVRVFFRVVTNFASAMARITRERQALYRQTGNGNGWITPHISTGGQISRNGVLYRSGGGSVFRPRGTDKIPAMLTQGEYVHKKQAVDYFGVDFMRKVNNMDVRGAMQALLTRAGNNNSFNRQSIVNNTVNNNQRVTQNISTNNPNFTRVQMGRFAGAL